MKDIEGTKDYYQHLLNSLKFVIKKSGCLSSPFGTIDELVDNEIDKCLKEYGVDHKLDEEEENEKD